MSKTYILRWNPEISSWKKTDYEIDFGEGFYDVTIDFPKRMNWSIYDWRELEPFDDFYMFTTGDDKQSKLVMYGFFMTPCYKDQNWNQDSGKRVVHYADIACVTAFHPDSDSAISVASLRKAFPDFDFGHGHAGMILDERISEILHEIVVEKRFACVEKAKAGGFYLPRQLPSSMNILQSDNRLYLNSSQQKLVEGFVDDAVDVAKDDCFKFAVAPNVSKFWDTFWALSNNAFKGKAFEFFLNVQDYKPIVATASSPDEIRKILEPYKATFSNDCLLSFGCFDNRNRCVIALQEKEIAVEYGKKAETAKFIKSLGFEYREDIYLFMENDRSFLFKTSVFGDEFDDKLFYKLMEKLGAHYMDLEEYKNR